MENITFRPHHFLCALGFRGMGYSPGFIRNFKKVAAALNENADIQVTFSLDTLCAPCPHNLSKAATSTASLCKQQSFIEALDKRHADALDLKENDILPWHTAKKRIKDKLTVETFHKICNGCSWKSFGVCEEALQELLMDNPL